MKAVKVKVCPAHHIEGPGCRDKQIKDIDVMELAVGDVNESRDIAVQVKEGVETDCLTCCCSCRCRLCL